MSINLKKRSLSNGMPIRYQPSRIIISGKSSVLILLFFDSKDGDKQTEAEGDIVAILTKGLKIKAAKTILTMRNPSTARILMTAMIIT